MLDLIVSDLGDERVLLFVKVKPPDILEASLVLSIKDPIKTRYSPRHVPAYVFQAPEIPYTVNRKKCEINVKQIVSGTSTKVSGTVANPKSLKPSSNTCTSQEIPQSAKSYKIPLDKHPCKGVDKGAGVAAPAGQFPPLL
ncbi:hypothetical protein BDV11DRAFT_173073 [Aspergillus similis]